MSTDTDAMQRVSDRDYRAVSEFLFREAQILDGGRFTEWLALLSEDMSYRLMAPTVSMVKPDGIGGGSDTVLMDETFGSLKVRVKQLSTPGYTITENPRSITRRFVTNILIDPADGDDLINVYSNVLVYRSRSTQMEPHLFSMSRKDSLKKVDGQLRLVRRNARLDESVVNARNIVGLL